ncbi:MAG: FlgD immunoglobulin-like domain containing protein, partial [Elusimicrobia bacterium]|nr:FlgD immunoglobulin-like domain containing protein [Elusimicrobiota bacterium]
LSLAYSTGVDPAKLNVYWYNAAANAYILQQDVTGAPAAVDAVNRTITISVNHFSTFVLFESGVAVISGGAFSGGDIEAFNFPNPFDLSEKTVTTVHPAANYSVRGTMIRAALPIDGGGGTVLRIYDVAGRRVRTIDLGRLNGGAYYYQPWDGRNDAGRDVADGVYLGVLSSGGRHKTFKMALIK